MITKALNVFLNGNCKFHGLFVSGKTMLLQLQQMLTAVPRRGLVTALGGFILCLSFASDFSYP